MVIYINLLGNLETSPMPWDLHITENNKCHYFSSIRISISFTKIGTGISASKST